MSITAIEVAHLAFGFSGSMSVLEDVSFSVQEGEFLLIFGPNGGGKTTLLRLLLGFLLPSTGTVCVYGEAPADARRFCGYVPQAAGLDRQFPISVFDIVLMGCLSYATWRGSYSADWKDRARDALARVGLKGFESRPFASLSGGQAQRVLFARAIVSSPKILILDEPTANIDPHAEEQLQRVLDELKGTTTILMVTHDLQMMGRGAGRMLCVHRTVTSMQPDTVCQHYALGLYHRRQTP